MKKLIWFNPDTVKLGNIILIDTLRERNLEIGKAFTYPPLDYGECVV